MLVTTTTHWEFARSLFELRREFVGNSLGIRRELKALRKRTKERYLTTPSPVTFNQDKQSQADSIWHLLLYRPPCSP